MKILIDGDEVYPVYHLNSLGSVGDEVDVPNDTLKRWIKVFKDFESVQSEISEFLGEDDNELTMCYIDEVL
jgi:hypothetical protein